MFSVSTSADQISTELCPSKASVLFGVPDDTLSISPCVPFTETVNPAAGVVGVVGVVFVLSHLTPVVELNPAVEVHPAGRFVVVEQG